MPILSSWVKILRAWMGIQTERFLVANTNSQILFKRFDKRGWMKSIWLIIVFEYVMRILHAKSQMFKLNSLDR